MSPAELTSVLIGTAGHIDHGKTRLVGRLTNVNTDRLPEEKARGISIDLGFANWEAESFCFGVVDVPGHERFVKNMVAGASGIDVAILVVAADDGVMPQTREHLDIMQLLGIPAGVIAITKIDLVDADFVELVASEIEDLTAGTFLEGAPIVPVSSETGDGLDELREQILRTARAVKRGRPLDFFRMPIDRAFSLTGHGSIVTGSVLSGDVQPGDHLELLPEQTPVRVRSVEHHHVRSADTGARRRTAVNLAGVPLADLRRGQELATPGVLGPTTRLVVSVRAVADAPPLKDRSQVSLHLGTSELLARVNLKQRQLAPQEQCFAEIRTLEPCIAAYGQRFILRQVSPARTIGGGLILDPGLDPQIRLRNLQDYAEQMTADEPVTRLSHLLGHSNVVPDTGAEIASRAGICIAEYAELLGELKDRGELQDIGRPDRRRLIHTARLAALKASVLRTIEEVVVANHPRRSLPRQTLASACRGIAEGDLLEQVLEQLIADSSLVRLGQNLGPANLQVKLSKNQRRLLEELIRLVTAGDRTPPTVKELAGELQHKVDSITPLLTVADEDGALVRVSDSLYFSPQSIEEACRICAEYLNEHLEATLSQLRVEWNISRKYAIPLGEYFDAHEFTIRDGDIRRAGPNLRPFLAGVESHSD